MKLFCFLNYTNATDSRIYTIKIESQTNLKQINTAIKITLNVF